MPDPIRASRCDTDSKVIAVSIVVVLFFVSGLVMHMLWCMLRAHPLGGLGGW